MASLISEVTFYPDDANLWNWDDHVNFTVKVSYRGEGRYVVARNQHTLLSSAGNWAICPPARNRRFYYFDFETACRLAEEQVYRITTAGMTWREFQEWRKEKPARETTTS